MLPNENVHGNLMLSTLGLRSRDYVLPDRPKMTHCYSAGPQSSQQPVGGCGAGQTYEQE